MVAPPPTVGCPILSRHYPKSVRRLAWSGPIRWREDSRRRGRMTTVLPARQDDAATADEPRVLNLRGRPATASAFRRRAAAVTVADCLRLSALRGSEVIAGAGGLDAPVHRASTASQTQGCVPGELRLLGRLLT